MVVVNQVQTVMSENTTIAADSDEDEVPVKEIIRRDNTADLVTVALGNTWCHTVNTRLTLEYIDKVTRQVCLLCLS